MNDRIGQVWINYGVIFLIVGPSCSSLVDGDIYHTHPIVVLDGDSYFLNGAGIERRAVEANNVPWEDTEHRLRVL